MIGLKGTALKDMMRTAKGVLYFQGSEVSTDTWQAVESPAIFLELLNVVIDVPIPHNIEGLIGCNPTLPWAEDHFKERVGREPLNPGEQYKNWPYYRQDENWREDGRFSHTYMERFWPPLSRVGIRYYWGNLDNVVELLLRDPFTRQAYLPIWFPEDTGAQDKQRVPCTLGYHFLRRGNKLHLFYPIRSCDAVRHLSNDVYMACRLVQWVLEELRSKNEEWDKVVPGNLDMHIVSLHCFKQEAFLLRK